MSWPEAFEKAAGSCSCSAAVIVFVLCYFGMLGGLDWLPWRKRPGDE